MNEIFTEMNTLEVPWTGVFSLFYDTINYRLQRYENGGNQCTERRYY